MTSLPLDQAVGERVRSLREAAQATRDDLARAVQRAGMRWDAGRVAHMEQGRVAATIPTLIGVAQALSEVTGRAIVFADLMPGSGVVSFADGRTVSAASLRKVFAGEPVPRPEVPVIGNITDPTLEPGWGKVDDRLVADLDIAPEVVRAATRELYGRTATQERDARAGGGATAQKRGRVTRHILDEVIARVR
ncbi:helix-turn-helix domain-containing protein [Mycobacteroides abscessus]|uniref:helix-turn-helix domain-containing protein n=2 Tax=Mycobacteroides abscessus TaxID=36809 RepID=UPI001041C82D|nr:helix-turn-helix transcriptional regulator [Mycobacteroides abscessus]MBN7371104.1 helix-turn-helix transcriptional regulator [Mycobacteroides abscessus subsp. abscessus]MBN7522613.1 helix-turn-helix transcriptional regulator [Mycobacteroides abscessus subsp. abscessus]MDB2185160.1 helix-turn-helix transcriptional regulator [Mycobacteroides abscessus subsp. abscessus]MDO3123487.1 helix-turn-helix transcriptional regulator [Mycobacteroides abscessus subsp. abscessus]MDO3173298.1 helix-turn-h